MELLSPESEDGFFTPILAISCSMRFKAYFYFGEIFQDSYIITDRLSE